MYYSILYREGLYCAHRKATKDRIADLLHEQVLSEPKHLTPMCVSHYRHLHLHKAHSVPLYRQGTDLGASGVGLTRKHAQNTTDSSLPYTWMCLQNRVQYSHMQVCEIWTVVWPWMYMCQEYRVSKQESHTGGNKCRYGNNMLYK